MPSDYDRCFYAVQSTPSGPCHAIRKGHNSKWLHHDFTEAPEFPLVDTAAAAFTGPPASDAALRVLVEQWRAAAAGLPTEADDYDREEAYTAAADELEAALAQSAGEPARCDVAIEACWEVPNGHCGTHSNGWGMEFGKFPAAAEGKQ